MTMLQTSDNAVFVVEDEVMIRMMLVDMLGELGHRISAEAGDIDQALRLAQSTTFDLAILDVNLNGRSILPVAELLEAQNRPFFFASGCGSSGVPDKYRHYPALQKPFQTEALAAMIDRTLKCDSVLR